jgi:iron-sulfur cluster repair protein YtfE (RIC family)
VVQKIDPIAKFMQEHSVTLTQLSALNRSARSLAEHGYSADVLARMVSALTFLQDEVGNHNTREEEALFPVLDRYVEGPTAVMKQEHRTLKRELGRLKRAIGVVTQKPGSKKGIKDLCSQAETVVQQFVNHIHKENNILFPLVQKFLTRDALREIARRMV